MASPLSESAVQAIELDAFSKEIPSYIPFDKTLYGGFKNNATIIPVSNITAAGGVTRPSFRVPLRVQAGAAISQGTGNGDSLGRGTGSQWAAFAVSPVFFYNVCEITFLARIATEGRKRGLFNVQAQELKNTYQQATQGLESLIQGDGTGTLDTIPTTATVNNGTGSGQALSSIVGLNNAFQFQDQQTVQVFTSGGVLRGSFVVSYTDPVSQTIYSATVLPAGTTTTDVLVVAGASGAAGGSVLGLQAWQVNSNTGTIGGLTRASYPGRLSTPTINLAGKSISTTTPYRMRVLLSRALGQDQTALAKGHFYCGLDQAMQMSSLYLQMQVVNAARPNTGGATSPDLTPHDWSEQWGGFPVTVGTNATPGRIDMFSYSTWYLGETLPLELYDFGGGITMAPVPDITNGGYLTSTMFAYTACFNLVNSNLRAGVYVTNAAQPTI
jgi:hypothetical protein